MARGRFDGFERPPWWAVVVIVAGALFLAGGLAYANAHPPKDPLSSAEFAREQAASLAADRSEEAARPRRVAFLGDSYTTGANTFGELGHGWPHIVAAKFGWEVLGDQRNMFGVGGSGYVNPGLGQPFGKRLDPVIASNPDIVIVAGGINDAGHYPTDQIAAAARDALERLRKALPKARIVVVGPFYPRTATPETIDLRDALEPLARSIGAGFIDPTPWFTGPDAVEISDDGTHPTDKGHAQIAGHMIEALRQVGAPATQGF